MTWCTPVSHVTSMRQFYWLQRVSSITHRLGLAVGGWEDGLMLQGNEPFDRLVIIFFPLL